MSGLANRLRGAAFYAAFYGGMAVVGGLFWLPAARSEAAARWVAKRFFRGMIALLRPLGVRLEVVGTVPSGPALIAAKHQSMLDVFALYAILPEPRFVMKRELARTPIFGWYATRVGCVTVDRSGGAEARDAMVAAMTEGRAASGQLVIYPQGTRVAVGAKRPFRSGAHALYEATGRPCIPVATDAGTRMPRGLAIHPGVFRVAFLEPIPPGMARGPFMAILEREIETASERLLTQREGRSADDRD